MGGDGGVVVGRLARPQPVSLGRPPSPKEGPGLEALSISPEGPDHGRGRRGPRDHPWEHRRDPAITG